MSLKTNKQSGLPRRKAGFTLLEILLVVGIIAILAGIVILAINPTKMLSQTRNTQRKANLSEINKALYQYYIDNGRYPVSVTSTLTEVCNTGATSSPNGVNCTGLADLSFLVPTYLTAIPTDPQPTASSTKYKVMKSSSNRVVLEAPQAELDTSVVVGVADCGLSFIDSRDGRRYATVLIGSQCWMQQNLNVGTLITGVTNQTNNATLEKYCYDNSEPNCTTYGGLYQWNEAMGYAASCNGTGASQPACTTPVQGICPTGWHIPSHYEFTALERVVCTSGSCATDFPYATSTILGWSGTNEGSHLSTLTLNGDNTSGFTALLAGYRATAPEGSFLSIGGYPWALLYLWSSLASPDGGSAWFRALNSGYATVLRTGNSTSYGYSVRCLKN